MKKSEITFTIALDKDNVPESISWKATDAGNQPQFAKALNIALWDKQTKSTIKIDLWIKDMPVDEMKRFYIDTIGAMADSIETATNDEKMVEDMKELCGKLAKRIVEEKRKGSN